MKLTEVWNLRKEGAVRRRGASFGTGSKSTLTGSGYGEKSCFDRRAARTSFTGSVSHASLLQGTVWAKGRICKTGKHQQRAVPAGALSHPGQEGGPVLRKGPFLKLVGQGENQPTKVPKG